MRVLPRPPGRRVEPRARGVLALLVTALLALGGAGAARGPAWAHFVDTSSASQTLSSDVLQPPTALLAAAGPCLDAPSVALSWTASASPGVDGYQVLRSLTTEGPFLAVGTVAGRQTENYTDTSLAFSTSYFYAVRATSSAWRSTSSAQVSHVTESVCL